MKQRAATYPLTYDEIVRIYERWNAVADKFGYAKPGTFTAETQADYFITLAQIITVEAK